MRGSFLATLVLSSSKRGRLWNQGLVNVDFDDNKTKFKTNYHISSVIMWDDFQSGTISKVAITKTNQANEKSWRRRPPKREVFFKTQAS